jgi:hypothetical protein
MEQRPPLLTDDELNLLREGHFHCDLCNNWVSGKVPIENVNRAIERGIIVFEDFCREGIEEEGYYQAKFNNRDSQLIQSVENSKYPVPSHPRRTFPLDTWEARLIDRDSYSHSLREQYYTLARYEIPLDFSHHCLLIEFATLLALSRGAGVSLSPWLLRDEAPYESLKEKLAETINSIGSDLENNSEQRCRCYIPRHGNIGHEPYPR